MPIAANDNFDIIYAMKVSVLVLQGVFDMGLATVLDTFATANELAQAQRLSAPRFQVRVVGLRRQVRTALGGAAARADNRAGGGGRSGFRTRSRRGRNPGLTRKRRRPPSGSVPCRRCSLL